MHRSSIARIPFEKSTVVKLLSMRRPWSDIVSFVVALSVGAALAADAVEQAPGDAMADGGAIVVTGARTTLAGFDVNFSNSFGRDDVKLGAVDTLNPSLGPSSKTRSFMAWRRWDAQRCRGRPAYPLLNA